MSLIMAKCVNCQLCKFELDMKIAHLNLHSARKKSSYIRNTIMKDNLDYFCATETQHCKSDEPCLIAATIHGFSYEEDYNDNCYGGVVVFHKQSPNTLKLNLPHCNTLQCVGVKSCTNSKEFALVCVYHAPQGGATAQFFNDITQTCLYS